MLRASRRWVCGVLDIGAGTGGGGRVNFEDTHKTRYSETGGREREWGIVKLRRGDFLS